MLEYNFLQILKYVLFNTLQQKLTACDVTYYFASKLMQNFWKFIGHHLSSFKHLSMSSSIEIMPQINKLLLHQWRLNYKMRTLNSSQWHQASVCGKYSLHGTCKPCMTLWVSCIQNVKIHLLQECKSWTCLLYILLVIHVILVMQIYSTCICVYQFTHSAPNMGEKWLFITGLDFIRRTMSTFCEWLHIICFMKTHSYCSCLPWCFREKRETKFPS